MWVSRRTDYATRAILALSLEGGGPLKLEELAQRTAVPQSVLEQVMPTMRTAGIVRSERGPSGGYRLNKQPEEITLERIVRLFQGPLAPISCATRHNPEPCPMTVGCTLRDVWEEVRDATISASRRRHVRASSPSAPEARGSTRPSSPRRLPAGRFLVWPSRPTASTGCSSRVKPVESASGEVRELVEPATGAALGSAAMAGEADVDRAVEAARAAVEGDWGRTPGTERSRLLHALADAIVANRSELAELEARNVGKAISSVKAELHQAVENFRYYGSAIASISGRSNPIGGSLLFYSLKEPVGVAAQIVPWNYPLMMSTWKLAPALAAGCSVVLKPDPQTPLTAIRLAELAAEVGFPAGAINVVPGDGPTTGAYLVRHPGVDKVAFTGSTKTGGEIMRLASDPVKRVTLELGGKSPNLVFADADLGSALPSSAWSIFYSAGQSCEARSRMLVEKSLYDEAVSTMAELRGWDSGRRPARRGDADGLAHLVRAPGSCPRLRRARHGGGR